MAIRPELRRARAGLQLAADSRGPARSCPELTRGYPEKRKREAAIRGTILGAVILLIAGPKAVTTILLYTGGTDLAGTAVFVGVLLITLAVQFVFDGLESILA